MSTSTSTKQLVWLITGTSTGIGRELTLAALQRGEKVIATARSISKINDLKEAGAEILQLDVTDPLDKLHGIAKEAVQIYGRVDVLVNNAAYIQVGALEECTTNIFGALNTTRAILPYMRAQKSGTVIWIGSLGGWRGSANGGLYASTKFATRALSESLHYEIEPLGLRSICFEPGYFRTAFLQDGHRAAYNPRISDYNEITKRQHDALEAYNGRQPGDPLALPLGSDCLKAINLTIDRTSKVLNEWEDVINGTDFPIGI